MNRPARPALPHDGGLALVGDADGRDVGAAYLRLRQRRARGALDRGPDLPGIMLDPAGLREVLRKLRVAAGEHPAVGIDDEGGRTGGALVERQDVPARAHGATSRLARSGRSVVRTSTPSASIRRIADSSFTVQTPSVSDAARAAATTRSLRSVYCSPTSVAPVAHAQSIVTSGGSPAGSTAARSMRKLVRMCGDSSRTRMITRGSNDMIVARACSPAAATAASTRSSRPS